MGRPKKKDAKRDGYRLRLDEETRKKLEFLVQESDLSKADILRKGIEIQYNLAKSL